MFTNDLYVKSFNNKFIKVVFITTSQSAANHFLETNPCCGVLKETKNLIFIANNDDLSISNGKK